MFRSITPAAALAVLALAACGERPEPAPTAPSGPAAPTAAAPAGVTPETARLEAAAQRLARALSDDQFRARLHARLRASRYPENKIHFQRTYGKADPAELGALARLNAEPEARADSILRALPALEVYLPVAEHRARWSGDRNVLVATAAADRDIPVAYDLNGGRRLLNPARPPATPVLAVVPVETDFDAPPVQPQVTCSDDACSGGSSGGSTTFVPGLYMTRAWFVQDFEGWLKGTPELEVHIFGQKGASDSLTKYQCAGEHRPNPYNWNGNTSWQGTVLLFSQTEINNYRVTHPDQTFRVVFMEDDDTECVMKIDPDRWRKFVTAIGDVYRDMTGAIDSGTTQRWIVAGKSLQDLLSMLASWIKSNDDLIGTAMEDKVVNEFRAGYNWVLKADDNVTNGFVNLEMR
jgi:hypothetical protein